MDAAELLGGRYRLMERLGEGGMSVVWRARDEVLRRDVAVKVLSARFLADWASRQRIRTEAQAVAQLSHPHVAGVYDYGESERDDLERVPYVVMELLSGPSLADLLATAPPSVPTGLRICAEVASALAAAHEQGVVHRDVKPANVVLTPTGAKVVDFGLAAAIGDVSEDHPDAVMYGTPAYLAPERLAGGPVVPGTDVYGVGLLLYRVLTGAPPWSADTTTQMLQAHLYVEPEPLPALPDVPRAVLALCRRCLAKDPLDRPTADEVARVLARAAGAAGDVEDTETAPRSKRPDGSGSGRAGVASGQPSHVPRRGLLGGDALRRRGPQLAAACALIVALSAVAVAVSLRWSGSPAGRSAPAAAEPGRLPDVGTGTVPGEPGDTGDAEAGSVDDRALDGDPVARNPASAGSVDADDFGVGEESASVTPSSRAPTGRGPGPQSSPSESSTSSVEATFEDVGGSVVVRCVGDEATLVRVDANEDYTAEPLNSGPVRVVVQFTPTADGPPTHIRARCAGGQPERIG